MSWVITCGKVPVLYQNPKRGAGICGTDCNQLGGIGLMNGLGQGKSGNERNHTLQSKSASN